MQMFLGGVAPVTMLMSKGCAELALPLTCCSTQESRGPTTCLGSIVELTLVARV